MREHEVVVVVHRGSDEFLVVLRSQARGGYWNLPAGGVEEGESAAEAAARELAEETGLQAPVTDLGLELGYEGTAGRIRVDAFSAEAPAGWEPSLDEEHEEWRWCTEDEAVSLLAYPEPQVAVRETARKLTVDA